MCTVTTSVEWHPGSWHVGFVDTWPAIAHACRSFGVPLWQSAQMIDGAWPSGLWHAMQLVLPSWIVATLFAWHTVWQKPTGVVCEVSALAWIETIAAVWQSVQRDDSGFGPPWHAVQSAVLFFLCTCVTSAGWQPATMQDVPTEVWFPPARAWMTSSVPA